MQVTRSSSQMGCKLAAARRLEQGVSIGKVARALEVNPNVLNGFPGQQDQRWSEERAAQPLNRVRPASC
jgi:transposase-like protein